MKCGGTSVALSLSEWFNVVYDHLKDPKDIDDYVKNRLDVYSLINDSCIIGHYAYDRTFLFQRYPELTSQKNEFKTFTFLREPLSFYLSFYYYSKSHGRVNRTLIDFFDVNKNMMAYFLPCTEANYKEVLDKYFFIGITERLQESLDKLAGILNRRKVKVQFVNKSERDEQMSVITDDFITKFKEKNKLDYLIYNYCLEKFSKL